MNSNFSNNKNSFLQRLLKNLSCFSDQDFKNSETTLANCVSTYSRITFNFLLLIIIFLCGFLGFFFGGREFQIEDDSWNLLGATIFALSLIFVLYNFTNKSPEVCNRLFIIYNILVDLYFSILIYDTNYQEKSFASYIRIINFYMLSSTIFLLYRYETTIKELLIFFVYKLILLIIFILVNNHTRNYINFMFEYGFFVFWFISLFLYKLIRQDYINQSLEYFFDQKYQNQYYQGLINMINKSFLSLNVSLYTLSFNNSFENFLKTFGLTSEEIDLNLKEQTKVPKFMNFNDPNNNKNNNLNNTNEPLNNMNRNQNNISNININQNENNFMNSFQPGQRLEMVTQNDNAYLNSTSNLNFRNVNPSQNNAVNSNSLVAVNAIRNFNAPSGYNSNEVNNLTNFANQSNNFNNFTNSNQNNLYNNRYITNNNAFINNDQKNRNNPINLNSGKQQMNNNMGTNYSFINQANNNLRNNFNSRSTDQNFLNNSNNPMMNNFSNLNLNNQNININVNKNINNVNDKNNYETKQIKNDEDTFIKRLDYILNNVFVNFYEESTNQTNENIFNNVNNFNTPKNNNQSRNNMSETIRNIFYSISKLTLNEGFSFKGIYSTLPTFPVQMTIELYYRKILTYQGEIMEFYFNDITSTRVVETERTLNKIRSLVLAKISHEFKVPLITIIYILKNYINSRNIKNENININNSNYNNERIERNNNNSISIKNRKNSNTFNFSADDYIRNTIDLGDYMLSLLNDIIDYSIINSEFDFKCEFENFQFNELMEFGFRILKILLACKGLSENVKPIIEIDGRIPKYFCNDEKKIKQILLNLLTNSIKFTKKGFIKLSAILLEDYSIKISVEDSGCGIQPEIIQGIFNSTYSLSGNNDYTQKSTNGLGLIISKNIIDKIGNKIECSSIINQKTVFSFYLSSKEESENNILNNDRNENLSYIDDFQNINKSGFTSSYTPVATNNNIFTNNYGNVDMNSNIMRRENISNNNNISNKNYNLSERINFNRFNKMKAEMNISKRQESPKSNITKKNRRNTNAENSYFGGNFKNFENNNNYNNFNNKYGSKRNTNNNNYNNIGEYRNIAGYEEEPTLLQSPRDIPNDLGDIAYNNSNYNSKRRIQENYYELKVYIKPILKYFETSKTNIILYVDDNDIIRKSVRKQILSYVDYVNDVDVICCKDGVEAFYLLYIDQISNKKIKIIVSDDKMDLINGDELYESIYKYSQMNKIKLIPFVLCQSNIIGEDNVKKINDYYFAITKNPKKEEILKLFEIARIK